MKRCLKFSKFELILYAIIWLLSTQDSEQKEFCSDSEEVKSIFTMGNTTYLGKGEVFYANPLNEKFAGKTSVNPKDIFKSDFMSISTGFFVSVIPTCPYFFPQQYCKELSKLDQMGFVIGFRANTVRQSYIAYRYDQGSLLPIQKDSEMPFEIKAQTEIEGEFWPISSDEDTIYLGSTYDETTFALVHVIQEEDDLVLYIKYLTDNTEEWTQDSNPMVHPMNDAIETFKGFIQIRNSNSKSNYALVYLERMTVETLLDFDSKFNQNIAEQRYFLLQVAINLTADIYSCSDETSTPQTSYVMSSSSLSVSPSIAGQSSKPNDGISTAEETFDDRKSTKSMNKPKDFPSDGNTLPTKPERAAKLGENTSDDKKALVWILIVVFIIGLILFMAVIFTILYIRHDDLIRKKEKRMIAINTRLKEQSSAQVLNKSRVSNAGSNSASNSTTK